MAGHKDWMGNICSADDEIRNGTIEGVLELVSLAAEYGLYYVNFHAGSMIDYQVVGSKIIPSDKVVSLGAAEERLVDAAVRLAKEGAKKGVLVTIENPPIKEWTTFDYFDPLARAVAQDVKLFPAEGIYKLLRGKVPFCIDIGHLFTEFDAEDDREKLMMERIKKYLPYISLWHFSTVVPPFNGTDSHDGFTDEDYKKGAEPSISFIKSLLELIDRENTETPIILEPKPDQMISNYQRIMEIYND